MDGYRMQSLKINKIYARKKKEKQHVIGSGILFILDLQFALCTDFFFFLHKILFIFAGT